MSCPQAARRPAQAGFTIIELLISTVIFAVILLVVTAGILQFSKQYYKGIVSSATQSAARSLVDDVTRSLQFNTGGFATLTINGTGYCVGSGKRYSYALNRQVVDSAATGNTVHQSRHGLISDNITGCNTSTPVLDVRGLPTNLPVLPAAGGLNNPRELLGPRMRLSKFTIVPNGNIYTVTVRVVYGDDDLLCSPAAGDCAGNGPSAVNVLDTASDLKCRLSVGSEYCAAAELSTTVEQRVTL